MPLLCCEAMLTYICCNDGNGVAGLLIWLTMVAATTHTLMPCAWHLQYGKHISKLTLSVEQQVLLHYAAHLSQTTWASYGYRI